ncbi:MAG: SPOR domain-containing protein [Burkholderiaceae bacterium]
MLTSRSGSQGTASAPPPQSIEVVRRRARHRLIGAAVLVLVGVLGFPLLFDTEPRPVAGDIPIEIPSRTDAPMIAKTEAGTAIREEEAPRAGETAPAGTAVAARDSLSAKEEVVESGASPVSVPSPVESEVTPAPAKTDADSDAQAKAADAAKAAKLAQEEKAAKAAAQAKLTAAAKARSEAAESARAKALLESKAPVGAERFVVQVGAFAEASSAQATRLKLERAGLATYTHVAQTASGKLIRVRVGPFSTRAEVDRAAAKVKALGLPARILTL